MRIIIIGVGKVGKTLTEFLVQDGHDVVVIDTNPNLIEEVVDSFDVKGIVGNGASHDIQVEAEIAKANVLIATTDSDELNILCCLVGKKNGALHTIARVRNPEYANQFDFLQNELGLDMVVNPELEAANEIARILRFPSATKIDLFANGRAEIVELKIVENSFFIGKTLSSIRTELKIRFLICAVERDGHVYIPDGNFMIQAKDKVYMTASVNEINNLFKQLGILRNRSKNIMLIGGGKITFYLAKQLIESNAKVRIIELNNERCQALCESIPEASIIHGDGSSQELLLEEGIHNVDAVVTLTSLDEENIIISLFAEAMKVPKVITKINHYTYTGILESIGLGSVISPKIITANQILRYVRSLNNTMSQVLNLYKLVNNQIEATEFYISEETEYTNVTLRELPLKSDTLIACIIRNNTVIIPTGDDMIKAKDSVVIISKMRSMKNFEDALK